MRVAVAQMAPVWLDREATVAKVASWVARAGEAGAQLVAFGEALVPGYPFWIEHTDGARFDSAVQKTLFAHYAGQAVVLERGDLAAVSEAARAARIRVVVGTIERAPDRGGHSLYCTLVLVGPDGAILNTHRKLVPTYEERLAWSPGDGAGLRTFALGDFTLGALNCWENWMPLARSALYAQGEDLHVALWPGSARNTHDITRHVAREGRSYVLSASGLLGRDAVGDHVPHADLLRVWLPDTCADGGSCIAGPDGEWVVPPVVGREELLVADLDIARVRAERQNFDPFGHYSRPDVLELTVRRRRKTGLRIEE